MFTGIIEEVGTVQAVADVNGGRDYAIRAEKVLTGLQGGDSISVDGVCQTVVERSGDSFTVRAIGTTLSRTTLGDFQVGRQVNLERPVAVGGRFGGHFVQGHVDGVGEVSAVRRQGNMVLVRFRLPQAVRPYVVLHGSIAIDGASLTINALDGEGTAEVALIPYTVEHTNLLRLAPGSRVNLESDLIGKYVAQALNQDPGRSGDAERLQRLASRRWPALSHFTLDNDD